MVSASRPYWVCGVGRKMGWEGGADFLFAGAELDSGLAVSAEAPAAKDKKKKVRMKKKILEWG